MIDTTEVMPVLETAFERLEVQHPRADFVKRGAYMVYRFRDQNVRAAILQKCARIISGLNAMHVLFSSGYSQEMGVIARTLDEIGEDLIFLCQARTPETTTELHTQYLEDFYQEEFDIPDSPFLSEQKRVTVPRKKIHAALARVPGQSLNRSDTQETYRTLSQGFSGFVHAASGHVMGMYGGQPPQFHLRGMLGTPRMAEMHRMLWTYTYRGLLAVQGTAIFFQDSELVAKLLAFRTHVETHCPHKLWEDPNTIVKAEKAKAPK